MEPITEIVTHVSAGTNDDLRVFDSMVNSTKIDLNSQEASRSMFTTPKTKYANEGFSGRDRIIPMFITSLFLVILLLAFRKK